MAGEITLQQLLSAPFLMGVFSQIMTPGTLFVDFLGLKSGRPAYKRISGYNLGWDTFNRTRTLSKGRAPDQGPARTTRQKVGHVSAMAYRSHEAIMILENEIYRNRPLGGQYGTVDTGGQSYVRRQIQYLADRSNNAREFMINRFLRGGFGISQSGEDYFPVDKGSGDFDVLSQIPSSNLGTAVNTGFDLGSGAALITAAWSTTSTDIIGQLLNTNKAFIRQCGLPLKHIFINSKTFGYLINNLGLIASGGSAYRVFESLNPGNEVNPEGKKLGNFDVIFRALPQFTFHIYDGVQVVNAESDPATPTSSNTTLLIPDSAAYFLPEPSDEWVGWVEGSEYVAENVVAQAHEVFGMYAWSTRVIDPPGWDLKHLDIGLPAIIIPRAVGYAIVA